MAIDIKFPKPFVTAEDILSQISEYDLYKLYCSSFPAKSLKSPFRNDRSASFSFFKIGSRYLWKDHAIGEAGDVFDFVAKCEGTLSFNDTINRISERLNLADKISPFKFDKPAEKRILEYEPVPNLNRMKILVIPQDYTDYDLAFWNQWMIPETILKSYYIKSALAAFLGEWITPHPFAVSKPDNPLFYFLFEKTSHVKLYQPYAKVKEDKFRSNCDNFTDIMGYEQCRIKEMPGRPLVLTKAMKEVVFYRMFGINAIAIHGESSLFYPDFIRHLRKYCGPIISVYDNDLTGVLSACKLSRFYMIPRMFTEGAKNLTDLWLIDPLQVFKFIKQLSDEFIRIASAGVYSEYTRFLSCKSFEDSY